MFNRAQFFTLQGIAHQNGFDLFFWTDHGRSGEIQFRLGADDRIAPLPDWYVVAFFGGMFMLQFATGWLWPSLFIVSLVLFSDADVILDRTWKSWHWLEHQTAFALERNIPFRDLHTIPPASSRCGTMRPLDLSFMVAAVGAGVAVRWVWMPFFVFALCGFLSRNWHYASCPSCGGRRVGFVLEVIGAPATIAGLLLQRALFMRRPTQMQTDIARLWAGQAAPIIAQALLEDLHPLVRRFPPRAALSP